MKKLFLLATLALSSTSFAQTIDFEEFPHEEELQGAEGVLLTKGFALLYSPAPDEPYPTGFQTVSESWRFNGRSAAMNANSCSALVTMTTEDPSEFAVRSIDLAELNGDQPVRITFVGTLADGSKVTHRVSLRGPTGWKRYMFPANFRNLQKLEWEQGDCVANMPHMFDNLVVRSAAYDG